MSELCDWFATLWNGAVPLTLTEISEWERATNRLRSEYVALRQKVATKQMPRTESRPRLLSANQLNRLFDRENRFFVCNTDRRWDIIAEKRMRQRGYAAAWEEFRYPSHMEQVKLGNLIFMYGKGVGIIGIGQATASHEVLQPADAGRLREGNTLEWRVPVNWLAWADDDSAPRVWKSPNATFFEVSDDKRRDLRERIARHFSAH